MKVKNAIKGIALPWLKRHLLMKNKTIATKAATMICYSAEALFFASTALFNKNTAGNAHH